MIRVLDQEHSLESIKKDYRARKDAVYLAIDRCNNELILSQRLPMIVEHINKLARDPSETVTLSALYKTAHKSCERTGGWCKFRWKIVKCEWDNVTDVFNQMRTSYDKAILLSRNHFCYKVTA